MKVSSPDTHFTSHKFSFSFSQSSSAGPVPFGAEQTGCMKWWGTKGWFHEIASFRIHQLSCALVKKKCICLDCFQNNAVLKSCSLRDLHKLLHLLIVSTHKIAIFHYLADQSGIIVISNCKIFFTSFKLKLNF